MEQIEWGQILIGLYVLGMIWLGYEAYNAPTYPDEYDSDEYL